ncbi:hypothetical protein GGR95_000322 [Sulfitobacter undariae]|uniref:Uncharacterized protein n=1 Tax=Sulfitobacter undariae TaxID=1563671 RepID=A0A7W6GZL4_9RHOB|nr:hypothetical protein [Sulfitobacter undariae]
MILMEFMMKLPFRPNGPTTQAKRLWLYRYHTAAQENYDSSEGQPVSLPRNNCIGGKLEANRLQTRD